ncbi:MAG: hypothetical protein AAF690_20720 [Acidobacteriota bacterium]
MTFDLRWLPPTAAFLVGIPLLGEGVAPPARLAGAVLLVGFTLWGYLRCRKQGDEVVRAANTAAVALGAPFGLGLAIGTIFAVRFLPGARGLVEQAAGHAGSIGPVAAAFGLGVLFTASLIVTATSCAWAAWWLSKR